jgi:hypothetical protein
LLTQYLIAEICANDLWRFWSFEIDMKTAFCQPHPAPKEYRMLQEMDSYHSCSQDIDSCDMM